VAGVLLDADIFVPEFWLGGDKALHQRIAVGVLHDIYGNATRGQQRFFNKEGLVLTDFINTSG
jgi:isocitrate dehydrogenase kinase/phosphatase